MLFSKETYVERRRRLREMVGNGLILIFGNNEAPMNYPANTYKFRQDSSFLYFFAQHRDGLVGAIDADTGTETLYGDEIDIEDIVWYGEVQSVGAMAAEVGVAQHEPMAQLAEVVEQTIKQGRRVHFLPPYRHDTQIQLMDLLHIHPSRQREAASLELIKAVVELRSVKSEEEIAELERASAIGYKMHTRAMQMCRPGVTEQEITNEHYCSDHTRTTPVSGRFTQKQREIYDIVVDCHDLALTMAKPGVRYWDVHFGVCRLMTERLKELGLMRGDTEEAVRAGAHALFLPHGLGHMMGMDVHDMEGLGQIYVGFDEETRPNLTQFGTNALRMGRRLQEGFVVTDEPGIYFIPQLIDLWRKEGTNAEFLCFDKIEQYKDFGGIRIEDDVLVTADGCRFLGKERIPYHAKEVEEFLAKR